MGEALKDQEPMECFFFNKEVPMDVWQQAYPFIKEAAEFSRGEFTATQLLGYIEKGLQELWIIWKGGRIVWAWVTEIQVRSGHKVCQVVAAGGTDHEAGWYFWPLMSYWMKKQDIHSAEVWCRPSMARLLKKKANFRTLYEVLTIEPEVML